MTRTGTTVEARIFVWDAKKEDDVTCRVTAYCTRSHGRLFIEDLQSDYPLSPEDTEQAEDAIAEAARDEHIPNDDPGYPRG